ncbi:MAG TPA: hypothetical protein VNX27_13105 [Chthoniobacterales bacterium]|nr:hypothetical protein [Chthoniobacterales bacterium]
MARLNHTFASRVSGELWLAHDYGKVYATEEINDGTKRLWIAASYDGSQVLQALSRSLKEPFFLLYALVIFRGGGKVGRYQSGELSHSELDAMFARFGEFWDSDGRHSVWLRSEADDATLIYDRHNLIYAYGPLSRFELVLESHGYTQVSKLSLSFEHEHHYYAEFDALERELTTKFAGQRSDLQPGDENPC